MSKLEILQRTINYINDLSFALEQNIPASPSKLKETSPPKRKRCCRPRKARIEPHTSPTNRKISFEQTAQQNYNQNHGQLNAYTCWSSASYTDCSYTSSQGSPTQSVTESVGSYSSPVHSDANDMDCTEFYGLEETLDMLGPLCEILINQNQSQNGNVDNWEHLMNFAM